MRNERGNVNWGAILSLLIILGFIAYLVWQENDAEIKIAAAKKRAESITEPHPAIEVKIWPTKNGKIIRSDGKGLEITPQITEDKLTGETEISISLPGKEWLIESKYK